MQKLIILSFLMLFLAACSQKVWEQTPNGVLIHPKSETENGAKTINLQVISEQIIRVVASPSDQLSEIKSLCVVDQTNATPTFEVTEQNDSLILSTSKVKAKVSLTSGAVVFYDENNRIILQERAKGGKSFSPITVEGTKGYSFSQIFESPDDEAFYGLGQHQSDEFNYKGRNEILYQYNTKVAVPFVVSNKNYGLLWDNYSVTKFGDPRDYSDMDLFTLYDSNGEEGGLSATYYTNSDTSQIFVNRKESAIDYENLTTIKKFPEGFQFNNASIVWKGQIEPKESGEFHFKLYYAGYTKVYINDVLVVPERWRTAWNPNTYKFTQNLEQGKKYSIRLEWKPDGGTSYIGLKVLSPRTKADQDALSLTSEMGDQIDYYFIHGNNLDDVISGYRQVTGKAQIMPKWAMGYWQSRERYKTEKELLDVVKEYRKRNIPLDNIVLDWSYWPTDAWGSHQFDSIHFPDPAGMVKKVHELNAKIMISVWPKFYHTTQNYKDFDSKGWMFQRAVKDSVRDWIGDGYIGSFYDAYNPDARKLFWKQIQDNLYTKGFDAWWMDASEPDILSNASIEYRKELMTPTYLGPSTKYFNAYALMNAEAIYDGQRGVDPDKRVFLLTRSGFAGLQRYSTATWSGDIGTRWEDMKAQISAGLNFAISGIPYWTMDIGGFCVENRYANAKEGSEDMNEWRELNARWFQFGAFCPLFRSHGQFPYREIYNLAPENHPAYKSMVYSDKLRYRLMPYIYSLAGKTHFEDYTIMRPLIMDFNGDTAVNNIGDQYMFGPSLMVAPVYKYKARNREVYFPSANGWYDFYSGKYFDGGQKLTVDAPYERMPLFVKEGSIVPFGPEIQYTGEKQANDITLYVYTGKDAEFTLYEDEGVNYNYEKGDFSTIPFKYNEEAGKLTIGDATGSFDGMLKSRTFNIVWVSQQKPEAYDLSKKTDATVTYEGKALEIERP
ncbi:MAG TPA: TIM-barrel domain-containing protein [Prolixibacteraceae bacterium]|nr:TIM-barrel domain-containing protein [Prolixibacteraceae bacterium]